MYPACVNFLCILGVNNLMMMAYENSPNCQVQALRVMEMCVEAQAYQNALQHTLQNRTHAAKHGERKSYYQIRRTAS
jgi:hypothetical protein